MSFGDLSSSQATLATAAMPVLIDPDMHAFGYSLSILIEPREHVSFAAAAYRLVLKKEFEKHARKWSRDTQFTSSLTDKYLHASYARIIGMGRPAAPLILERLKSDPDDWFYALRAITGANPVKIADAGSMKKMSQSWLDWGRERGLCQ